MKPRDSLCCPSTCRGQFEFVNLRCIFYVLLENVGLWLVATWLYTEMQHSHSAGQHQRSCSQPTRDHWDGRKDVHLLFEVLCFGKKCCEVSKIFTTTVVLCSPPRGDVALYLIQKEGLSEDQSTASAADTQRLVLYHSKIIAAVMMLGECWRHGRISVLQRVTAVELLLYHEAQAQPGPLN